MMLFGGRRCPARPNTSDEGVWHEDRLEDDCGSCPFHSDGQPAPPAWASPLVYRVAYRQDEGLSRRRPARKDGAHIPNRGITDGSSRLESFGARRGGR